MFEKVKMVPELVDPILGADIYDMQFITTRQGSWVFSGVNDIYSNICIGYPFNIYDR